MRTSRFVQRFIDPFLNNNSSSARVGRLKRFSVESQAVGHMQSVGSHRYGSLSGKSLAQRSIAMGETQVQAQARALVKAKALTERFEHILNDQE